MPHRGAAPAALYRQSPFPLLWSLPGSCGGLSDAANPGATAKRTATRSAVKAKPKKTALRAKTKRAVGKRLIPSRVKSPQPSTEPPIEVIKVETVNEPVPGTVIVTEYETVRVPAGG